jgi:hypothetical protein
MSENDGNSFWVGDLQAYMSYPTGDDDDGWNVDEDGRASEVQEELNKIGKVQLLAGKSISAKYLYEQGIAPSEWRNALHQSEMSLGHPSTNVGLTTFGDNETFVIRFVKGMLNLGRPYAVARYARLEKLDYPSAVTATLPYGLSALVNQFLLSERIPRTREAAIDIRNVLDPHAVADQTAYHKTGMLQTTLHRIADDTPQHLGGSKLDRGRMRTLLALTRLYFTTIETKLSSLDDLRSLLKRYELERKFAIGDVRRVTTNGRPIKSWRVRHIQPLYNFYPYAIRHGLQRAVVHGSAKFDHVTLVNELALAHCGLYRMRAAGRRRPRKGA